jgi:hypothetical protein
MRVDVYRYADNGDATLSVLMINGIAYCHGVEDEEQKGAKVAGETRVSEGTYTISLRAEGGYHTREEARYKDSKPGWHKGMLCIHNAPDWKVNCPDGKTFQYILIHPGNTEKHTNGCYLPNMGVSFTNFAGSASRVAYEIIYPIIRDAILKGEEVTITYHDIEGGK